MRKFFKIMLATILAVFTIPFAGISALADGKVYDNIKDGEYTIGIESPEKAANNFLLNKADLSIQGEDITLTVAFDMDIDMDYYIDRMTLDEQNPSAEDEDDRAQYFTFKLDAIISTFPAKMTYVVPDMFGPGNDYVHDDVDFQIVLDENDLDKLPETEEPGDPEEESGDDDSEDPSDENGNDEEPENEEQTEAPDERVIDELLAEKEADAVYQLNYETDSRATAGQLKNPVKLLEKGNKKYVQMGIEDRSVPLFRSLKINGKEVTWNSITEGPYLIQFELPNGIEDELGVSMVIQAGSNVMPHDGIKLWFDKDSLETIKEPEPEEPKETELDPKYLSEGVYTLDYTFLEKGTDEPSAMDGFTDGSAYVKVDKNGNQFVAMTLTSADWIKGFKVNYRDTKTLQEDKKADTRVVEFTVEDLTKKQAGWVLVDVPGVYAIDHDVDLVFDTDSLKVAEDSEYPEDKNVEQPTVPEDPEEENGSGDDSKDKNNSGFKANKDQALIPAKAYEIDYVVKHATRDEPSAADGFFVKPGILLEKDGGKYLQITINNWDMIDWVKYDGKNVHVIKVNNDGSALIQLKITGELADVINLSMEITVPGVYDGREHDARLILDPDSLEEIPVGDHKIYDSPAKPEFGQNGDNGETPKNENGKKTDNPKTGDTSKILLYAFLLMGSLIPLAVQFRRRFV